jgi:hypothetical protein
MNIELSKDGQPILTFNGMPTCSFESPQEEAQRWIARHRETLLNTTNVFVLGLGSGYHVRELAQFENLRQIWIIDDTKESKNFYFKYHKFDHRFKFYNFNDKKELKNNSEFRLNILRPYKVIDFYPAVKHNREFFNWLKLTLVGRTEASLVELLALRADMSIKQKKNFKLVKSEERDSAQALSIKDLKPLLENDYDLNQQQLSYLNILQELVR